MAINNVLPKNIDLSSYVGQWVVICNDKLVAHAEDLSKLKADIKNCRRTPVVAKIPKSDTLIF